MKSTWERPKTSRVYLHAPGASRIALLQPDFKLNLLDLDYIPRHTRQNACGVHLLAGLSETAPLNFHTTIWDTPHGGFPIYTIRNTDTENGCSVSMTAFASVDTEPTLCARVTVCNTGNAPVCGRIGLLPRSAPYGDQYLTGLWDTGYESYQPNWKLWLLQRTLRYFVKNGMEAAEEHGHGHLKILSADGFDIHWISREEQKNRFLAQDYFACDYTALGAGCSLTLDFAFSVPEPEPMISYDRLYDRTHAFWAGIQSRITGLPQTEEPRLLDAFRQNVTQCLQMLARYRGRDGLYTRQGDVGRFLWVWESVHVLTALDRTGFHEYTTEAYKTLCSFVKTDGEPLGKIEYPWVAWDNAEGALLFGIGRHLQAVNDPEQFRYFLPYCKALLSFIDAKRKEETGSPYPGLYPRGKSGDWGEIGYHWVFTDGVVANGLLAFHEACRMYSSKETSHVRAMYNDCRNAVLNVMASLYAGHENEEAFILPHIAGVSFEESYNHCFYVVGAPYLCSLGLMNPNSVMFEQMENFYRKNGLFEQGLCGRVTNATDPGSGAYGDCYYTGWSELCWLYPWMERGEHEKVEETHSALMNYNMTPEYIVCERYCSFDPWYTPWQPNGSGSGRIVSYLLDYCQYTEKKTKKNHKK